MLLQLTFAATRISFLIMLSIFRKTSFLLWICLATVTSNCYNCFCVKDHKIKQELKTMSFILCAWQKATNWVNKSRNDGDRILFTYNVTFILSLHIFTHHQLETDAVVCFFRRQNQSHWFCFSMRSVNQFFVYLNMIFKLLQSRCFWDFTLRYKCQTEFAIQNTWNSFSSFCWATQ